MVKHEQIRIKLHPSAYRLSGHCRSSRHRDRDAKSHHNRAGTVRRAHTVIVAWHADATKAAVGDLNAPCQNSNHLI